ncbi:hypothetical protein [Nonomuraea africana]|uniref:Pyruvate-formate lyase-activating enzyme n=1 Tax=Nonomuraea africana TaxID=46171 RepID=A0ABR9K873_9ACTN|nr:hypothetical protein [Nonomuraea africana]MBE1558100.1 pyruvate-formate lyase-activating enzyme [Nonomuraea africana]
MLTMAISPLLPFTPVRSPSGDIVVFYTGTEPRMTPEQALAFADQLREMAAPSAGLVTAAAL